MKYTVTLQIEITDAEMLNGYIKNVVAPEFCLRAEEVSGLTPREALIWIYDNGAFVAGDGNCRLQHRGRGARNADPAARDSVHPTRIYAMVKQEAYNA